MSFRKFLQTVLIGALLLPAVLDAAPGWSGNPGQAPKTPEITEVDTERGKAVKITAVSDGSYQSAILNTGYPVPLADGGKITFDLRQAVRGNALAFAVVTNYADGRSAIRYSDSGKSGKWAKFELAVSKDADCKGDRFAPIPPGKVTRIMIYPYGALDAVGQYYEIADFKILDAAGQATDFLNAPPARSREEIDATYIKAEYWRGMAGQAKVAPEITVADTPYGPTVFAKALARGAYQGFRIDFPEPVDLENVGAIDFDFFQTARPNQNGDGSIIIIYEDSSNGLMGNFHFSAEAWNHVTVPIDLRTLQSAAKQSTPVLGKVHSIQITLYSAMNSPGDTLGIANLKFLPKNSGAGPIKVVSYNYLARATSGDSSGKVLTDGEVVKADQAFYRAYADEPEIVFDLGAIYLVDSIALAAVAVPSQNISDCTVFTSNDGENFRTAAYIANKDASAAEKVYAVEGKGLNVAGRYVKLRIGRSRTDFPVNLAEVSFTGKIPTDAELAAVAASNYTVGPDMPEVTPENYVTLKGPDGLSVAVSRQNGVALQLRDGKEVLAERIFNSYELVGEKAVRIAKADSYTDKVVSLGERDGGVEVVTVNPALPDLTFTSFYSFEQGNFSRKLTVTSKGSAPRICYTALGVTLPRDMRDGGLYETWGSGHDLQHKFVSEVIFDYPADSGSAVIFESPERNRSFLSFRYRYNDRYTQIGSGTVTIAGFGDKRTIFTPNGWLMSDGIFAFNAKQKIGSVESLIAIADGDVIQTFARYLALPEVKKFRSAIKRADWLKDLRLLCTQEWDGYYGDTGKRIAGINASLIREGYAHYSAADSDYHWGDFPTSGEVRNCFGGRMTAEALRERDTEIRRAFPNVKLSQYTWLWSVSPMSRPFREFPEWFIVRNAQGQEINFFPGVGKNYYRLVGIPESRDEIVKSITDFVNFYNEDVWYVDGGGSPATVDWPNMRIDEPDAYDRLYTAVRNSIRKGRPDRAVFFNNPENPLGDMGYLESFDGVMTTNWRDGATWMYKFKLWQRPDPVFSPLYIYWLPGVDRAFRQYAAGTGLGLTFGGSDDRRRDVGIMQAQHQSRFVKLVSADVKPNWRYDGTTRLELMPLTFGRSGWLFVKNNDDKTYDGEVSTELAPLGADDEKLPVYRWCFTLLDHGKHKGLLGEKELEENYRNLRWASDFIIQSRYLGPMPWVSRATEKVEVAPKQLKLLYFTQSPAVVYSVDALRMQFLLDDTLGVKVSGRMNGSGADLTVESGRKEAEIACLVPAGQIVSGAAVNGKNVPAEMISEAGARLALIPVGQGASTVKVAFAPAPAAPEKTALKVVPGRPGKVLTATWDKPGAAAFAVYDDTALVRNLALKADAREAKIAIPTGVTGKDYTAKLLAADGSVLAETNFKLAAGTPKIARYSGPVNGKMELSEKKFVPALTPVPGVKVLATYSDYQPTNGTVTIDPAAASITIQTHPMYESLWNRLFAGMEVELKRYVKVRLSGNFDQFKTGMSHGFRNLSARYDNPDSAIGIMFDFANASGAYTTRTLATLGLGHANRTTREPSRFGAARTPDVIGVISTFAVEARDEETFWIDLNVLGAPSDWAGKAVVSAIYSNITPDRRLTIQLLESSDTLPAGAEVNKFFPLKGGKTAELKRFKLPASAGKVAIDGKLDESEWKDALRFTEFSRLGSPALFPPKTVMMLRRDGDFLCLAAELTEPRAAGFTLNPEGKPWFNDGVEIYLQSVDGRPAYTQYVIAGAKLTHSEWASAPGAGKARKTVDAPEYQTRLDGGKLYIEAKIPLKALGSLKSGKVRFNLARNRMVDGNLEGYTLVPGKGYLNFAGAELEI